MCRKFSVKHSNDSFCAFHCYYMQIYGCDEVNMSIFQLFITKEPKETRLRISCPYRQVAVSILKQLMCATAQLNTVQSLRDKKLFSYW